MKRFAQPTKTPRVVSQTIACLLVHLRLQVRCLVGGMSGVTFRGLGSCRVHIFLRIADAPVRDLHVLHAIPAASANLASTEVSS